MPWTAPAAPQALGLLCDGYVDVARGMVDNDQTWRMFAPYELVWAGGVLGGVLAQGIYWGSKPIDRVSQSLSRYR